jgi:hypothetical protein
MDGWAGIHVAGQPLLSVSTDSQAWDTLVNQRTNIAAKSQPEPTQSVVSWPRGWSAIRPLKPLTCGLAPRGLRVTNIPVVTLSLVEFQMFF